MKQVSVVYTRVSTDKTIQKTSLLTQREYYTDYCERKGYELYKIYADEGLTGTNARREAFREMLFQAGLDYTRNDNGYDWFSKSNRKPEFNIIICKDVSRFSRGSVQGQMIIKLLKDMGVNTVFENSGMSTFDDNWQMNIGILFNIAENESASMSKRIKFAKRHKREKKVYAPSRVPFGYMRNDKNEIVVHPEQSEIVKYIFTRYLEVGSNIITNELNEKGILSQTGVRFTPDKITRMISNTIYYGEATVNRTNKNSVTDTRREKNDKTEYISIPNVVDPLISKEEWQEANEVRISRINKTSKRGRKTAKNDVYFGKLICSSCGSRYVRHIGEKEKISYMCQSRRKGGKCKSRSIAINVLNKFMRQTELAHMTNSMGDSAYYTELNKRLENEKLHLNNTQLSIQTKIENLNKEIDNIVDQYMTMDDSDKFKQRLINRSNTKEDEIAELEKLLAEINISSIERIQQKVESKKEMIETISNNKNFTQEEKLQLLNKVDVGDYALTFHFSMPSYEEEVREFNELFTMNPIDSDIPYTPFAKETFRRDHKASREYWHEQDEESRESEAFYNE